MASQIYKVTLTDLGVYTARVAAEYPEEAERIAETMLFQEATELPPELAIVSREASVRAEVDTEAEAQARQFLVEGTYSVDFELQVSAATSDEAERHAERLCTENGGPFEFLNGNDRVSRLCAREIPDNKQ